ncbi:MAG TPA: hypothetical protein VKG01_19155 [Thermoanaerobaculia bacterium]|nr:hypothetical protein [Thermoanaerobaculia bacterium]
MPENPDYERTGPLKILKQAVAVELALAGGEPRRVEVFVAEHRENEFRRQDVLDLLERVQAFLPARNVATGEWELFNKDALLWIGVPPSPLGSAPEGAADELFEFRRPVRVDFMGGQSLEGEILYSAPAESTRLVDYVNEPGRFLRLWTNDLLTLINKAFVLRVVERDRR